MGRRSYEGVAVAIPVTVPYVRYSIRSAHWWLARCLAELLKNSGLRKEDVDGLSVSSFTLAPDTAIGLTQHLGLSPRWLDHLPLGDRDRKSTRLNSSHGYISYAVFCLKKKKKNET